MKEQLDKTLRELIQENALVYINESSHGTGDLFLGGKRVKGICHLTIIAQSDDYVQHKLDVNWHLRTEEVK